MDDKIQITEDARGQRLDVFCVVRWPQYSRAALQKAIKKGQITVNDVATKPRYILKDKDIVQANLPEAVVLEPALIPDIEVLYEDDDVVVVNKPAGVNVHAAPFSTKPTVTSWFVKQYPDSKNIGEDPIRPGVVHRLDQDTTGVMIMAKTDKAFLHLKDQFKQHRAKKEYLAIVFDIPGEPKGRINRALAKSKTNPLRRTIDPSGKPAITEWHFERKVRNQYALLRVLPLTGRTHQIRVHLHFLGFPIVGDKLYNFKRQKSPEGINRQMLHAESLEITMLSGERAHFTAPLPADFRMLVGDDY